MGELRQLTKYLHDRCPAMDHHNLAVIRERPQKPYCEGRRWSSTANSTIMLPLSGKTGRGVFGAIVEPMLQWAKRKTIEADTQFVPCTAGNITGVIYANGDVSVCENHPPLGNLRDKSFYEIWDSAEANRLRAQIQAKDATVRTRCFCGRASSFSQCISPEQ